MDEKIVLDGGRVKSFFEWIVADNGIDAEWLVIGKGPTYRKLTELTVKPGTHTISLNHTCRENRVDVAHIIDLDVLDDCGDAVYENARFLVMPLYPHVKNVPGQKSLEHLVKERADLARLELEGRLLFYVSSTSVQKDQAGRVVTVRFFSGDAVISLLATAGVRIIQTIGVDGGSTYSNHFKDLNDRTLLANGRTTFDAQSSAIGEVILRTGVKVAPFDRESPVKVYVGAQEEQMLAVKILEYSIKRHASMSVEVVPMHRQQRPVPMPKDAHNKPRTPFSFQRFLIPEFNGFRGRAIYFDSDMLVFKDIKGLWSKDMATADV